MKGKIRRRDGAKRDLILVFQHYAREAGVSVARRFRKEAQETFSLLAGMPGLGTRYEAENPAFAELRYFPIGSSYRIYLVFYRPMPKVEVGWVSTQPRDDRWVSTQPTGIRPHPLGRDPIVNRCRYCD